MKILRIKFHNLNSLSSGDIDLENGPLSQAGIFAITGPTGAGKSTILDAITLALYGKAARYGSSPNPEHMMSRHSGGCGAEVLFEVPRGRFVARWDLRRARGKSTGNLQPAKRAILDEAGTVLAERLGEADRLIEELTGLDCGRFLRSVLLAQGEFAQFLKASANDRAELLESLTGTVVYSELSTLAYQECSSREQVLVSQEEALGRFLLLSEEERGTKTDGIAALGDEIVRIEQARDGLAQRIGLGRQLAALTGSENGLVSKQEALIKKRADSGPDLDRLKLHQSAQPFFQFLQILDALAARATEEARNLAAAQNETATAKSRLAAGVKAAGLLGEELVSSAEQALKSASKSRDELAGAAQAEDAWIAVNAADKELDPALPRLIDGLTALTSARKALGKAQSEAKTLARDRKKIATRLETLNEQFAAASKQVAVSGEEVARTGQALGTLLKGRTLDGILAELAALEQKRQALTELCLALEKRDAVIKEGSTISDDEARLVQEIEEARTQKGVAEREAEIQATLLENARTVLALSERIASFEEQRDQLKKGEPCPLCGSPEHPFANADDRPSEAIEEARRNVEIAKVANTTAATEFRIAIGELAKAEEALRRVQQRRAELRQEQMDSHEAFEKLARAHRIFTAETLSEALAANQKAREEHDLLAKAVRTAETVKSTTELAHVKQQAEAAKLNETIAGEQNALARLDDQFATNTAELGRIQNEIEEHSRTLSSVLAPFGLPVPEVGSETETRNTLEERRQGYQKHASNRARTDSELKQAGIRIESLERQLVDARGQAGRLADLRNGESELAEVKTEPSLVAEFRRNWTTADLAQTALVELRTALVEKAAFAEERRKNLQGVQTATQQQLAQLRERLAGTEFANPEALRAARLSDAEAKRIEESKLALEAQLQTLAGQLAQVRDQLAALRARCAPEGEALEGLELERKGLEEQIKAATEKRTTLRNELEQDERNRAARSQKAGAIEELRQRLKTWQKLRELIGSADGAKFRRFAQGLSLDVLVRHANRHLRRLSERYELRRTASEELMLEIVDLHQASVTRPMLSLSGGESFLASLALALGLSDLAGRNVRIDSLFIDEGFGSLDPETLDLAVAALDTLRLNNKTIGVISHVELLKERIPVQIRVEKLAGGQSLLHLPR
ncbi:MAG: AAA family ATPase [Verrucomicrobiota bacterium]